MATFHEGDIVTGTVTGIEDYGIFLSFEDNQSGLIHISEISDSFVKNVNDYAKINDSITVKILSAEEGGHYKLSLKELNPSSKGNAHSIVETKTGFSTLKEILPTWIQEASDELEKK